MSKSKKYFTYNDLIESIRAMFQRGGQAQLAAEATDMILGRMGRSDEEPFLGLKCTKHGENRIPHCVKYDLNGFSRLITIQDSGICVICFLGNHDECEKWLTRNKGLVLTVNNSKELQPVRTTRDISIDDLRIDSKTNWSTGKLVSKIPARYYDRIAIGVKRSTLIKFEALESTNTEEEIMAISCEIGEIDQQNVFFDVFNKLRAGDSDGAKQSIDLYTNQITKVENLTLEEIEQVVEGDAFADPETVSQLLNHFMTTADYRDWMLFMGREQKEVVNQDFSGPAKLAGVSGSGKTCVVVKRAIRLAQKYSNQEVLVLTLNPSLSRLISVLVDYACPPESREKITVKSFWQLCQEELKKFEPEHFDRLYADVTWKNGEHVSEIWEEYYDIWNQREFNNRDASVMLPIHRELLTRSVCPKEYLAQELDWIRSAVSSDNRADYISIERKGRHVPFNSDYRSLIVQGLEGWEKKMKFVGVTDDLGLALALHRHLDEIRPNFRCILVDEAQDFGTIELEIVRRLVKEDENDLFLCGDLAQRISTKHHNLRRAGIDVHGRSKALLRNYRNSKEILLAAHEVLSKHLSVNDIQDEDFEVLDPEFANFSSPKPLVLEAENLEWELASALDYIRQKFQKTSQNQKACIAIAGLNFLSVKQVGKTFDLPVLDNSISIQEAQIFLSDLAQIKGYEFDSVCILNCAFGVMPDHQQPEAEAFRDLSRLYVAMTRAKYELIISYSGKLSKFISGSGHLFTFSRWSEHSKPTQAIAFPRSITNNKKLTLDDLNIPALDFLYQRTAIGLPSHLQDRLLLTVTGVRSITGGRQTEWPTIKDMLLHDRIDRPLVSRAFGAQWYAEFKEWLRQAGVEIG